MQKNAAEIVVFPLRPSRLMRALNLFLHVAVFGLLLSARSGSLLWLTTALLLGFSAWQLDGCFALRSKSAIRFLRHDAEGWSAGVDDALSGLSRIQPIELQAGTTVTAAFVVLSWRDGRRRRGHLLLTAPMLGSESYRRLCRLLWQSGKADQADEQSV